MPESDDVFTPSRNRLLQAENLADGLIYGLQHALDVGIHDTVFWGHLLGQPDDIQPVLLRDVQLNMERMVDDFKTYTSQREGIPCLVQDESDPIPISIAALSLLSDGQAHHAVDQVNYRRILSRATDKLLEHGQTIRFWQDASSVGQLLRKNLSKFLALRASVGDFKKRQPAAFAQAAVTARLATGSPVGNLAVSVTYNTSNMRIHSSPAYFLNWTYFGSSPSPVVGSLPPGLYKFAGDSPTKPNLIIDNGVFSIPANFTPTVIAF